MKLLWLASWYPSRIEPYNGDFVQRHAEAASLYHDITVLHVIKDDLGAVTNNLLVEKRERGRLTEFVGYYHSRYHRIPFLGRLVSVFTYQRVYKKLIKAYLAEKGRPDLVHVHVCMRAGLLALWAKQKYDLAYVVTEHNSAFLPEAENNINTLPIFFRRACLRILKRAAAISVVSNYLGEAIRSFSGNNYVVIPNVVNTTIFKRNQKDGIACCRFIHISGLDKNKRPDLILDALANARKANPAMTLVIVGPPSEKIQKKIEVLNLTETVTVYPMMPQPELATILKESDALLLFSRYETFGCVLIEANACGVPVIVNSLPVIKETVAHGVNGLLVQDTVEALAEALVDFSKVKTQFNPEAISHQTEERFGYQTIGAAFSQFYASALKAKSA